MSFQYKRVLLVGATSGIGAAMADRLIKEGSKVIAVGRRQERLDQFVQKHGKEVASSIKFDMSDRSTHNSFVKEVTTTYPDLDCVFLNAGTQGMINLADFENVDLDNFFSQMSTNFNAIVELSMKFLPFLTKQKMETSLVITGTHLSLIPAAWIPAYSASKAALNSFVMSLRLSLKNANNPVKIIEIWPPLVQTELHDYMGEERGRSMGMPVDVFTEQAYAGLAAGKEHVLVGAAGTFKPEREYEIVDKRQELFAEMSEIMKHFAGK